MRVAESLGLPEGLPSTTTVTTRKRPPAQTTSTSGYKSDRPAMRYVLHRMPYSKKDGDRIGQLDSLIVGRANVVYERGEKDGVPIL